MIATDENALLCDLAETYGIFDFNALPVETLAALSFGLRENSRIKRKMSGALEVDEMELLVDKSKWPVPTYGDLLFRV